MSTLVARSPRSTSTARCSRCGLEIIATRRRSSLYRRGCPRCLPGQIPLRDIALPQMIRSPSRHSVEAVTPTSAR